MPVTNYIWDDENDSLLMETDENDNTTVVYTNEPDHYGHVISQRRGNDTSYYHFDANGSTQALTNAAGDVTDSYLYDAFGAMLSVSGATQNAFRYLGAFGYYFDSALLITYVRARSYKPALAR